MNATPPTKPSKSQAAWLWIAGLFGNNPKVIILIFVFLVILVFFAVRCSHASETAQGTEAHLAGGVSFGCLYGGPVLDLDIVHPLAQGLAFDVGTTLWGAAHGIRNNWDWHARVEFSRGSFGAAIGPLFLQNIDTVDGSHTNFSLMLFWRPWRVGAEVMHLSNGGTSLHNCGRNAALVDARLR